VFINRVNERKRICEFICSTKPSQNKVLFITGRTGVGKSELMQYVSENELLNLDLHVIRVHISKSSPDTIENNHYFDAIYAAIAEHGKEKVFDRILSPAQHGTKKFGNWIRIAKGIAFNKAGVPENAKLFEPTYPVEIIHKRDYILDVVKVHPFVIDIENIQNIDTISFEMIIDILQKSHNLSLILEYTIDDENQGKLLNMMNELGGVAQCQVLALDMLNFDEAVSLMPEKHIVDAAALKEIYEAGHGNLMLIIMAQKGISKTADSITVSFEVLTKNEKFILYLLYWSEGSLSFEMLHEVLFTTEYQQYQVFTPLSFERTIESLVSSNFIIFNSNGIIFRHDSIIDEISKHDISPITLTAYQIVKEYYLRKRANNGFIADEYIEKLFVLFLKSGDSDIADIIESVKHLILRHKYPKLMLSKINYFQDRILRENRRNLSTFIKVFEAFSELCYYLFEYDEAWKALRYIYQADKKKHRALRAALLSVDHSESAQHELAKMISAESPVSRLRLSMELCVLIEKMKTCSKATSEAYAHEMLQRYKERDYLEIGYLLRCYAELINDFNEVYDLYRECIDIFTKHNRLDLCAEIYVSIAMVDAYHGNLDSAMKQMTNAVQLSPNHILPHYYYNNIAVILLLQGSLSTDIEKYLNDSLLLGGDEYTRVIVMSNLMVYYCLINQITLARELAMSIESGPYIKYEYEDLQRIVLLNLSYFYSFVDFEKQQLYKEKLSKVSDDSEEKSYMPSAFYKQFPYRIDFLGYWEFEISQDF
jgi:hypothetical protein